MPNNSSVKIGDATLYLANNKNILPSIQLVDAVITDPPYSEKAHLNSRSNKYGARARHITFDSLTNSDFVDYVEIMLEKAQGWVVMTCDFRHAALIYEHPSFIRLGAWVKQNPMPQITGDRPGLGFETVAILHSGKVKKEWNRGGGAGIWTTPAITKALIPTQKPTKLISCFVDDFTKPDDLILDPFMGAGTTGVVAIQKGRRYIGIESNEKHYKITVEQIRNAYEQVSLLHYIKQGERMALANVP